MRSPEQLARVRRRRAELAAIGDVELAFRTHFLDGVVTDVSRRFIEDPGGTVTSRWTPTRDPAFAPTREIPITMEDCALFAAERTDVLRAENAARELADRLRPWHAPAFTHVRWWVIPATFRGFGSTDTRPGVNYALMFASTTLFQALPDRTFGALLGNGRAWASAWADAAAADLSGASRFSSEPIRFAALPNPFEPLAELEATGYSTMEWMTTDGGVLLVMLSES